MKRARLLGTLVLAGFLAGCSAREDRQRLQAEMAAIRNQQAERKTEVNQRLQTLDEHIANIERNQAQTVATSEELRTEMQRLHGEVQQALRRAQGGAPTAFGTRDALATKLAELETRMRDLETTLLPEGARPSTPMTPPGGSAPPAGVASSGQATGPAVSMPPATIASQPPAASQPLPAAEEPAATEPGAQLYQRALREHRRGNHEAAIIAFKEYLRRYPKSSLAGNAQYWIGESLYAQRQFEAAIVAFDEVVRKYPTDEKVPAALLKQGYAFAELDDTRNARFFLQQVQRRYPQSPEAQRAAERLRQL
jgi:tol-pal system protein YbgF